MTGEIYRIAIRGDHDSKPHPHVVILEFEGSRECLIVPAFDSEGFEVNAYIDAYKKMGYREDQLFVEIDNTEHVNFTSGHSGKKAYWLVARHYRLSVRAVTKNQKLGTLSNEGVSLIARGLLALSETKPEDFSSTLIKKLRQLCR